MKKFSPQVLDQICKILDTIVDKDTVIPGPSNHNCWSIIEDLILVVRSIRYKKYPKLLRTGEAKVNRRKVLTRDGFNIGHVNLMRKMIENGENMWRLRMDYKTSKVFELRGDMVQ